MPTIPIGKRPAVWTEGDWNGDGVFDQYDILAALPHYSQAVNAVALEARSVPEGRSFVSMVIGTVILILFGSVLRHPARIKHCNRMASRPITRRRSSATQNVHAKSNVFGEPNQRTILLPQMSQPRKST